MGGYLDPTGGGTKVQGAQGWGLLRLRPEMGIYSRITRAVTQRKTVLKKQNEINNGNMRKRDEGLPRTLV